MRYLWLIAAMFIASAASAQGPVAPVPAGVDEPICAFGRDAAGYRQEAYCTAQVALRSSIARSFALLSARMATSDGALGAALRRLQDADGRVDLLARLERQARADGVATAALAEARTRLDDALAERTIARTALEAGYPQWVALTRPRPISERETSALLRPGEVLIFWLVGNKATFAFAIDRNGASWERVDLDRAAIERSILDVRDALGVSGTVRGAVALSTARDPSVMRARGTALYRALFPRSVGVAARRAHTLLLVPSGPLSGLPFAALPTRDGRDPRWLGLARSIALLPSPGDLRTLRAMAPLTADRTSFIGFGAPQLGVDTADPAPVQPTPVQPTPVQPTSMKPAFVSRGGDRLRALVAELPPLPEAKAELLALAALVGAPESAVHVGRAATERAVKTTDLSKARIVAFATHGLVAGEIDGLSEGALVLTSPASPDAMDDGLLTASEAAQLHLDADWVLLSACSTAAGDRVGGEALSGLAAAFGYAGARALLVSHWQVRDDAARRLTTLALADRALGRGEALRQAMRRVATDRRHPEWHDPSVWAVMTLIGDPAN